jgi:tubulin-specific chaperone C
MHTSSSVRVHLAIASNPIIEHCTSITFAGYPGSFHGNHPIPNVCSPFSNLACPILIGRRSANEKQSKHYSVQDFSHIRQTLSPNWSPLPSDVEMAPGEWAALAAAQSDEAAVAMLQRVLPVPKDVRSGQPE